MIRHFETGSTCPHPNAPTSLFYEIIHLAVARAIEVYHTQLANMSFDKNSISQLYPFKFKKRRRTLIQGRNAHMFARYYTLDGTPRARCYGQAASHLAEKAGKSGGEKFEGVRMMCYDSAAWVRKNFKAKADKHNEVSAFMKRRFYFEEGSLRERGGDAQVIRRRCFLG